MGQTACRFDGRESSQLTSCLRKHDVSTRQFGGQMVCVCNERRYRCSRLFLLAANLGKKIESECYSATWVASTSHCTLHTLLTHSHTHTHIHAQTHIEVMIWLIKLLLLAQSLLTWETGPPPPAWSPTELTQGMSETNRGVWWISRSASVQEHVCMVGPGVMDPVWKP